MEIRAHRPRLSLRARDRRASRADLGALLETTAPVSALGASARLAPREMSTRGFERQRELDRECSEVTSAILLASGGRASRVVVCNLEHGPVVAQAMRGLARRVAVDLVLLARGDGTGTDIAVQSH